MATTNNYSGTIYASKQTTYLPYDSSGSYSSNGDVLTLPFTHSFDINYKCSSISGDNFRMVSSSGYSTTPTVTVSLVDSLRNKSSIKLTIKWQPQSSVAYTITDIWTLSISDNTQTIEFNYFSPQGVKLYTDSFQIGANSDYVVRQLAPQQSFNMNGYVYYTTKWTKNGITYDPYQYLTFTNKESQGFDTQSYEQEEVSLSVRDYPNRGQYRSYSQYRCVSGTGLTSFTVPANPSQEHYTFNGYFNNNNTVQYSAGQVLEGSTSYTIYARWTGVTYSTAFSTSGSSVTTPVTSVYPASITLPNTTKAHYTFDGWYDAETGGNRIGGAGDTYQPSSDTILYAHFTGIQYTVTYDTEGSTATATARYPATVTLPSRSKTYYTFQGWYDASTGGTKIGNAGATYQPTADITIYAQFTGNYYTTTLSTTGTAVSPSSYNTQYPNTITLPSTSKTYYDFQGWYDASTGGNKIGDAGSTYQPTSAKTLYARFTLHDYDIHFIDADGSNFSPDVHYTTAHNGTPVSVPTPPDRSPLFAFAGWQNTTTASGDLPADRTTVNPTENVVYKAVYTYTLLLKKVDSTGTASDYTAYNNIRYPNPITSIPTSVNYTVSGYRFAGWSYTKYTPSLSNNRTPDLPSNSSWTFTPDLTDTRNTLYTVWNPAVLESITIASVTEASKNSTTEISVENGMITIVPDDWAGTLNWERVEQSSTSKFSIAVSDNGRKVLITGIDSTNADAYHIKANAHSQTWNPSSTLIESNLMQITVSKLIQVNFWTRGDDGAETQYLIDGHQTSQGELTNAWFVEQSTVVDPVTHETYEVWEWVVSYDTEDRAFPPDASRNGYTFAGWIDGDGTVVTDSTPPHNPTDCYALWLQSYTPKDRDVLLIQQFNPDGDAIQLQMDLGLVTSNDEKFVISLNEVPTPTMSSDKTFITDMSCTETVSVELVRKNPKNPNDNSDNSENWSNKKWIETLRGLVDRWQADTDGIKMLYIPRGMRTIEVFGELVCYGDNYDMLGYIKPREYIEDGVTKYNTGLLYNVGDDEYVLVGYNGLVTSYNDSYKADSRDRLSVSLTITLGGMVSMYQDWAKELLIQ